MNHLLLYGDDSESGECFGVPEKYAKLKSKIFCCMPVIKLLVILELVWSNVIMTHVQGQELHASYMDGVTVKISEHYKPPPRISLPITYAQRLSLNKQLQDNMPSYDCFIEARAKEQLESLKKVRNEAAESRKLRSERIKEEMKEREEQKKKEAVVKENEVSGETVNKVIEIASPVFVTEGSSQKNSSNGILQPTQVRSNILTPIPLNSTSQINNNPVDRSPFNISDFEADTSSPFDNMELKTLNDMEELAQVLRGEAPVTSSVPAYATYSSVQSIPSHSYSAVNYNSYLSSDNRTGVTHERNAYIPTYAQPVMYNGTSDFYLRSESAAMQPYSYASQSSSAYNSNTLQNYPPTTSKTVPDILRALEAKLEKHHISNVQSSRSKLDNTVLENKKFSVPILKKTREELDDPFTSLSKNLQDLATTISSMGFPLPRVARACQLFGDDHKKVSLD